MSRGSLIAIVLIGIVCLAAYSNTFSVPFHFDDKSNIVENPAVKDMKYFSDPLKPNASGLTGFQYHSLKRRFVGFLTFALNYKLHGLDVFGYHVFNLSVHFLNGILVYLIVLLTFRTPYLAESLLAGRSRHIALFSALLFVSHPIQTQAVTYIVQRLASLATMFYLASLASYAAFRLKMDAGDRRGLAFYPLALLAALCAMKTKEMAFTLPIIVVLYEAVFFRGSLKRRLLYLAPVLLMLSVIPLTIVAFKGDIGQIMERAMKATDAGLLSRKLYFLTQLNVVVTYLRLFVLPVNQNLYYDYPTVRSFSEALFSSAILLSLAGFGLYLFLRHRRRHGEVRLMSFGIFWFFITLSVESSFIPIMDVIYEHRAYLPSAGLFMAASAGLFWLAERLRPAVRRKAFIAVVCAIPVALSAVTYARNSVWKTETALWEDVVKKSPASYLAHVNLGAAYWVNGSRDEAVRCFQNALRLNQYSVEIYSSLGNAFGSMGFQEKAVQYYETALKMGPNDEIYTNLGSAYMALKRYDEAIEALQKSLRMKRDNPFAYNNLGNAYYFTKKYAEAEESYRKAILEDPAYSEPRYNLVQLFIEVGNYAGAWAEQRALESVSPEMARKAAEEIRAAER